MKESQKIYTVLLECIQILLPSQQQIWYDYGIQQSIVELLMYLCVWFDFELLDLVTKVNYQ